MKNSITRRGFVRAASAVTAVVGTGGAVAVAAQPAEDTIESLAAEYRAAMIAWNDQHEWSPCGRFWHAKARKITSDKSHPAWSEYYDAEDRMEKSRRALLIFVAGEIRGGSVGGVATADG